MEEWFRVPGYPTYEVSSHGRARNNGGPLVVTPGGNGKYPSITLCGNGKYRTVGLHRILCEAYHGPPQPGQNALHKDDDKNNVSRDNLYWGTHRENYIDAVDNNRMPKRSKLDWDKVREIRSRRASGDTLAILSQAFEISEAAVVNIVRNRTWKEKKWPARGGTS